MAAKKKQDSLPGIEKGFPELEQIGFEYAEVRDRRMAALKEEVELKSKAIPLMQQHNLTEYKVEGLTMKLVPGEVKLKVVADKEDDEDVDAA